MLHLSGEPAVANGPRRPTLCSCSEAFFFFSFFISLALAVFPSAGGAKQRMCQKHMRSRAVSACCVVLVLAVVVVVVVVVLHWSWPRVLLFIPLLQLSLLCLRRPAGPAERQHLEKCQILPAMQNVAGRQHTPWHSRYGKQKPRGTFRERATFRSTDVCEL